MTYRELPAEEWFKLEGHPGLGGTALPPPEFARCLVMEDESGAIKGFWWLLLVPHCEPVWVDPEIRNTIHIKGLLEHYRQLLDTYSIGVAFCHTDRPEVAEYLTRLGLLPVPAQFFALTSWESPQPVGPQSTQEPPSSEGGSVPVKAPPTNS